MSENLVDMVMLQQTGVRLTPDPRRVVARPFLPGVDVFAGGETRLRLIADRVFKVSDGVAESLLEEARQAFAGRHHDLEQLWEEHAAAAGNAGVRLDGVDRTRRLLVGAYFTYEFAPEGAALCNPSIVVAPDSDDTSRFVLSLRAIGEGHISSVEFRTGSLDAEGEVTVDAPAAGLCEGARRSPTYAKQEFADRLIELGPDAEVARLILSQLEDRFTVHDLEEATVAIRSRGRSDAAMFESVRMAHWVATSNYEVSFPPGELSGRVIIPAGPADSRGIEDVRFTRFVEDDGSVTYYGMYTAYDGYTILPQLIETADFTTFRLATLSGPSARNKGMALFPRRIEGRYVALGRLDQESIYVMRSDRVRSWTHAEPVYRPTEGWEAIQVGNCGPPIETEQGWLVLTHGVGPMRQYSLGALMLDLDHPERAIGRLESPLLAPFADERDGYVPNVVYSCGALLHDRTLVIPYGFSDYGVGIVTAAVDEVLGAMVSIT